MPRFRFSLCRQKWCIKPHGRYMTMTYRLINVLILSFFLPYAVSPLSYRCAANEPGTVFPAAETTAKGFGIFWLELFYSGFAEQSEDEDAPDSDRFIIKKSSTLLRSPDKVVCHASDCEVFTATSSVVFTRVSLVEYSKIRKRYGSMSLCSGLAPPLLLSA